jgi:endogenous inhibitor of DNA gyrase (YacG/DUF329 family)
MTAEKGLENPRIKHTTVPCPVCGKRISWTPDNKWRPFSSEHCRLIDLGEWLTENKRIPVEPDDLQD